MSKQQQQNENPEYFIPNGEGAQGCTRGVRYLGKKKQVSAEYVWKWTSELSSRTKLERKDLKFCKYFLTVQETLQLHQWPLKKDTSCPKVEFNLYIWRPHFRLELEEMELETLASSSEKWEKQPVYNSTQGFFVCVYYGLQEIQSCQKRSVGGIIHFQPLVFFLRTVIKIL